MKRSMIAIAVVLDMGAMLVVGGAAEGALVSFDLAAESSPSAGPARC